jgi:hypothetical protein
VPAGTRIVQVAACGNNMVYRLDTGLLGWRSIESDAHTIIAGACRRPCCALIRPLTPLVQESGARFVHGHGAAALVLFDDRPPHVYQFASEGLVAVESLAFLGTRARSGAFVSAFKRLLVIDDAGDLWETRTSNFKSGIVRRAVTRCGVED